MVGVLEIRVCRRKRSRVCVLESVVKWNKERKRIDITRPYLLKLYKNKRKLIQDLFWSECDITLIVIGVSFGCLSCCSLGVDLSLADISGSQ